MKQEQALELIADALKKGEVRNLRLTVSHCTFSAAPDAGETPPEGLSLTWQFEGPTDEQYGARIDSSLERVPRNAQHLLMQVGLVIQKLREPK